MASSAVVASGLGSGGLGIREGFELGEGTTTWVEVDPGWLVSLLGWPALLGSFVLFLYAVDRESRRAAIVACVLAAPTFLYLTLAPRFSWIAPVAFLMLCVLAWRVEKLSRWAACLLALPALALLVWLAAVLGQ